MILQEGATKVVEMCAAVKQGEEVLVITDCCRPDSVGRALANAAMKVGAYVTTMSIRSSLVNGEPGKVAASAIGSADVVLAATSVTLGHCNTVKQALARGTRVITLTECTEETLTSGAIEADFRALGAALDYVKQLFDSSHQVHVTSPGGTNLYLDIGSRLASVCGGVCDQPGTMIGVPDVEVYIAPRESSTNGTLVVDGTCSAIGRLVHPIALEIHNGRVTSIEGGQEAQELRDLLESAQDSSCFTIAEFALGLNPKTALTGRIIEDEGAYGTGHFALGRNVSFGGMNDAPLHLDLVYLRPSVWLDDQLVMRDGVLMVGGRAFPDLMQFERTSHEQK